MIIKVRFFTSLREIVGKREESLSFNANEKVTVNLVLKTLTEEYGDPFKEYIFNDETSEPKGFLQFLVNGNSTATLNGLETELKDSDVMAILPPAGGG